MTKNINDGGPASPVYSPEMLFEGTPGMSRRDWFVGHILQGMWANPAMVSEPQMRMVMFRFVAIQEADALLAELDKPGEGKGQEA